MFLRSFDARIHIWHLFHVRESKPPTRIRQHIRASRDASTLTSLLNRQLFSFRSEATQIPRKDDHSNGGITGGVVCMIDPSIIALQNLRMDSCGVSRGHACMRLQKATTWYHCSSGSSALSKQRLFSFSDFHKPFSRFCPILHFAAASITHAGAIHTYRKALESRCLRDMLISKLNAHINFNSDF